LSYIAKELKRLVGKAVHSRDMIRDGDHLMVAVSGGKDSLVLLWLLRDRIKRIPIEYKITAVHLDLGFGGESADQMESFFITHGFEYRIIKTDIGPMAHSEKNLESPCFLCSRLRRKRLFQLADELGCKRIAFGHHKDDLIETFFLNVFYSASISTMLPVQQLFGGNLTIIRPLFLVDEERIQRYARSMGWEEIDSGCPTSASSKRIEIKTILTSLYKSNKKIKGNIFHALQNVNPEYLR
jgi:tRNA 2-thiocytidine biosynthesis protein TtcA